VDSPIVAFDMRLIVLQHEKRVNISRSISLVSAEMLFRSGSFNHKRKDKFMNAPPIMAMGCRDQDRQRCALFVDQKVKLAVKRGAKSPQKRDRDSTQNRERKVHFFAQVLAAVGERVIH